MYSTKSTLLLAIPLAFAVTLGAAPQQSDAASVCQKVRGVAKKGCVRAKDIRKATVRAKHIKTGAVTADKLAAEALAGGRVPLEDCGFIDQPGSYVLVGDLPGPLGLNPDGGCLVIQADNVNLDLAGFSIVGDRTGGFGILMEGRSDVAIHNGTIRNFGEDAIYGASGPIEPPRNHLVSNIRAIDNKDDGINLAGSDHQVTNCLAIDNGDIGIHVGFDITLTGNTANGNIRSGIVVDEGAAVTGNTTNGNGDDGISTGPGASVTGNTAKGNGRFGIRPGAESAVAGNVATGNGDDIASCPTCQGAGNVVGPN